MRARRRALRVTEDMFVSKSFVKGNTQSNA